MQHVFYTKLGFENLDLEATTIADAIVEVLQTQWESDLSDGAYDWTIWLEGRIVAVGRELARQGDGGKVQVTNFFPDNGSSNPDIVTYQVTYRLGEDGMYDHTDIDIA